MKKILAWILTAVLLLAAVPAGAEETGKYDRLTVGTGTPFSGNFFSAALGNNASDQDVRRLIHGYNLVYWDSATGSYQFDSNLVSAVAASEDGLTYTIALNEDLKYNDGTAITARDYAFSLLLLGSAALQEAAGGREDLSRILGGRAYQEGKTSVLAGFRLLGDYYFTLSIDPEYYPYFYQLKALEVSPLPVSVLAPGCTVKDNGQGVYLEGDLSADLLKQTLTDPEKGYMAHPSVTSGPYMLTGYDGDTVILDLNPEYAEDENGEVPEIPQIVVKAVDPDRLIANLASGEIDLAVRCARADQVLNGTALLGSGDFAIKAYSRTGLSFISFCTEAGPTADVNVRKAIAHCLDKENLTTEYLGAYGTPVDGYYGIGQWMFMMANGTLVPEEGQEEAWAGLTLENIPRYELSTETAASLLDAAGWNLNDNYSPFIPQLDTLRYREENGQLIPLSLKLYYPEGNGAGPLLEQYLTPSLASIGAQLIVEEKPFTELLQMYYGQAERDCDMILMATNFGDVFDPSADFDANGTDRKTGITDPQLMELAQSLRTTTPGDAVEFCRRWLAFQEYRESVLPEIPVYSDAYLDFHIIALRNYEPGSTGSWAIAVTSAYLSDEAPEEETEGTEELEDEFEGNEFEGE